MTVRRSARLCQHRECPGAVRALRHAASAGGALPFSPVAAAAENPEIAKRRAAERKTFTDAEIIDGFFKVTFGAEFHVAGARRPDPQIRRAGAGLSSTTARSPTARQQVAAAVADIRRRIRNLDIAIDRQARRGQRRRDAGARPRPRAHHPLALRRRAARAASRSSLEPQCLSSFRKDDSFRILHSDVILVADAGDFIFYDCAYEELLQALGPINDDATVPWSMFNDDVQMGFFGIYDQYLLNILYDPRIRPGMTRERGPGAAARGAARRCGPGSMSDNKPGDRSASGR